jgi:hypothetical protein
MCKVQKEHVHVVLVLCAAAINSREKKKKHKIGGGKSTRNCMTTIAKKPFVTSIKCLLGFMMYENVCFDEVNYVPIFYSLNDVVFHNLS